MATIFANYVSNTQTVVTVPAAPTGLSATVSVNTATVSFTPSAGATSYTATSNTGGFTGTSTGSPITVSGLTLGTYTFTVTATNATGTSAASVASGSVIVKVPDAPTGVSASILYSTATISFTPSAGATSYTATSNTGGFTGTSTGSPITVNGLAPGTYTFTVTATGVVGTSVASAASGSVTVTAPAAPTGVSATASGATVTVSFTASASALSYTATSSPGGITGTLTSSASGALSIPMSGFIDGTSYTFTVTATNAGGTSPASTASNSVSVTFTPLLIGSPLLWLDASDAASIITSGNSVTQWTDKSGKGNHFTGSSGSYPTTNTLTINGKNALNFTANSNASSLTNSSITLSNGKYTIFAVGYTNTAGYGRLLSSKTNQYLFVGTGSGTNFCTLTGNGALYYDSSVTNKPAMSVSSPCIMGVTCVNGDGGWGNYVVNSFVNGSPQSFKTGSTSTITGLTLGRSNDFNGQNWGGAIAEVLIYPNVLSEYHRAIIEGYLAWKWGLQTKLPPGHYYYYAKPVSSIYDYEMRFATISKKIYTSATYGTNSYDVTGNYRLSTTETPPCYDVNRGWAISNGLANFGGWVSGTVGGQWRSDTAVTFTKVTYTFWIKPTSNVLGYIHSGGSIAFSSSGIISYTFTSSSGTNTTISDTTSRGLNQWTFYAITNDGSNQAFYVNGSTTPVATSNVSFNGNTYNPSICYGNESTYFRGYMDDFRLYKYAFTPSQTLQVYNETLKSSPYGYAAGILDDMTSYAYTNAIGIYALKRCFTPYVGGTVNIRRASDNATSDFYADKYGKIGTGVNGTGTTLATWLTSTTGYVTKWYDQSGKGNHLLQTNTTYQPQIILTDTSDGVCIYMNNAPSTADTMQLQTASSPWSGATTPSFHVHIVSKPKTLTQNVFWSLNTTLGTERCFSHCPWADGNIYYDAPIGSRVTATYGVSAGQLFYASYYKSNSQGGIYSNGNKYSGTNTASSPVDKIGLNYNSGNADSYVYSFCVFAQALNETLDETLITNAFYAGTPCHYKLDNGDKNEAGYVYNYGTNMYDASFGGDTAQLYINTGTYKYGSGSLYATSSITGSTYFTAAPYTLNIFDPTVTGFTVAFWVYLPAYYVNEFVFMIHAIRQTLNINSATAKLQGSIENIWGNQDYTTSAISLIGGWHHVCFTCGSGSSIKIYYDGTDYTTALKNNGGQGNGGLGNTNAIFPGSKSPTLLSASTYLLGYNSPYQNSYMDDFRIYTKEVDAAQVGYIMNNRY